MTKPRISRRAVIPVLVAGAALMVAGCTSNGEDSPAESATQGGGQEAGTVAVTLREWSVEASPTEASPGPITFDVDNAGNLPHNFVVFSTDLAPDELPVEGAQVVESEAVDEVARIEEFPSGSSESLNVELDPGAYVLVCNLPGHYEQGMHTAFSTSN